MGTMIDLDQLCAGLDAAGMQNIGAACRKFAGGMQAYCGASQDGQPVTTATAALARQQDAGGCGCGCGGACKGGCGNGRACGIPQQRPIPEPGMVPSSSTATPGCAPAYARPGGAMPPKCYDCSSMDECLAQFLYDAQLRLSPWEYEQLRVNENPLVNLDKFVGSISFQNYPLTANTSGLFAQQDEQRLPYRPLAIKAQPEWTGTPANSKVILTFYAGPYGLDNLTSTSPLVQIGSPFKLSNFTCHDDCYFGPFPEFESCRGSAIPFERSVYVKVEVGATGQSTLNGLGLEIIKHKTYAARNLCSNFNWFCG